MTIEKQILLEKKEFAAGFGDWLFSRVDDMGDGSWVYVDDSSEQLYDILELVDHYIKDTERFEKKVRKLRFKNK